MTRPRIWKDQDTSFRPWRASHPDNPSLWRLCETWQEAMDFAADKLENPLPLELEGTWGEYVTFTYQDGDVVIIDGCDHEMIALAPHHWRPLARALTRLADLEGCQMSRKEYRVVHKIPNITAPVYFDSLEEAKQYVEPVGKYALDWVIQVRTVTEWEDA